MKAEIHKQFNPEVTDQKIPVVVGVTGHRDLVSDERVLLINTVRTELKKIKEATPSSPHVLLCCLAEGADLLCAETALEEGFLLYAALPMEMSEYEKQFSTDALDPLHRLLDRADRVFVVPQTEPFQEGNDYCYRQADIYVAVHCHVLLALWDGKEGALAGCGTAETVEMKLKNKYQESADRPLHPADGAVIRIAASRGKKDSKVAEPGKMSIYGNEKVFRDMLRKTEQFNRDVDALKARYSRHMTDESRCHSEAVYDAADRLSIRNAKIHRQILGILAVAATLLTLAFLLYDEAEQYWLIILCGVMVLCLFLPHRLAKRMETHRKYLEYRVLAESLRVQIYMNQAQVPFEVSEYLPWNLQTAVPWVRKAIAVCKMDASKEACPDRNVRGTWIREQMEYHRSALEKTKKQETSNDRIVRGILFLTVFTYFIALLFEIFFGGLFGGDPRLPAEQLGLIRTILKITLGTFSAITLFAGNYYGKLSLENVIDDHDKMIRLYEQADSSMDTYGETEELFRKLAKEALAENSAWYSYEGINSADINL